VRPANRHLSRGYIKITASIFIDLKCTTDSDQTTSTCTESSYNTGLPRANNVSTPLSYNFS
jgi:hypothetical protein